MPLLSRKVDYALLIVSYLHHRPEGGSAREIAARFELSRPFVANILKLLCHKGFVVSHRGVKGGYALSRPAAETPLLDLMDALDDPFSLAECNNTATSAFCDHAHLCPVRSGVREVHRRLREVLGTVMLADLFGTAQGETDVQLGILVPPLERQLAVP